MPQGELFFRTNTTKTGSLGTNGWVDTYTRYGLSMEPGAMASLMKPAPAKDPQGVSVQNSNGTAYDGSTIGYKAERQFTFDVHIVASGESDYLEKFERFCTEILNCQYIQLKTGKQPTKVYHLLYMDVQEFSQFLSGMAKLTITFKEPHPEIRHEI